MNLLLLSQADLVTPQQAVLKAQDRRFKHLATVLKAEVGVELKVGVINQKMGKGKIIEATADSFKIEFSLTEAPPFPHPAKLIMALPRPKALLRVIQNATTMGVKEIYFIHAYRVEKAFWSCEQIKPTAIDHAVLLGLEQARDTQTPKVILAPRFKPFVEDHLAEISKGTQLIIAHPVASSSLSTTLKGPHTIMIGPEGGWIPYEVEMLQKIGFKPFSLGPRILRSETAMISLLARVLE